MNWEYPFATININICTIAARPGISYSHSLKYRQHTNTKYVLNIIEYSIFYSYLKLVWFYSRCCEKGFILPLF